MADSEPLVIRTDEAGLCTLTLNRPEKLNALSAASFVELRAHLEAIAVDDSVGCVVLRGAGRSFCAGNDLGAIRSGERAPSEHYQSETVEFLERLPQPTIARIHGHCFTGGLELALGCDLLYAASDAQIGDTHGQWGLVPVWGMSVRLPERVGRSRAKELMFTAQRIDGDRAAEIGLVDGAAPADELDALIDGVTTGILANSRGTNRIVKKLIASGADLPRTEALAAERTRPFGFPEDMAERMARG